jgi:hypothetical protein
MIGLNWEESSGMSPDIEVRLDTIENLLRELVSQRVIKDFYSTAEVAARVDRSEYQVRQWCRTGRIQAVKRNTGRGRSKEWMVPHDELVRYENHGLRAVGQSPA